MGLSFVNNYEKRNVKHLKGTKQAITVKKSCCNFSTYIYCRLHCCKNIDSLLAYWLTDLVIPNITQQSTLQSSSQFVPNKVLLTTLSRASLCQ